MKRSFTRFFLSIPFVFAAMAVAFGFGTYFGGNYLVPPGQGLAGPAEAMGYGLLLALVAITLAIIASVKMPLKMLGIFASIGAIISVLGIGALSVAIMRNNAETEAYIRSLEGRQATSPAAGLAEPVPENDPAVCGQPPC